MFRIKKLDIFVAKQFGLLFLGTFFICQFVLMMQFLWRYVDELIGKGLTLDVLAQFFWYMGLMLVPQALPLAILLSSLIAYGNLGESSELTAIKAAGISLMQSMRSLIVAVCLLACCSFYFQNVIGPEANKSFRQLLLSMKQKSPELEIPEGIFYDGIPNCNLYVQKKAVGTGMLYGIMIYKMNGSYEDAAIILADSGRLQSTAEKKHLLLTLYSGEWFENMRSQDIAGSASVPYRRETFSTKRIVLDFDGGFSMADVAGISGDARTKSMGKIFHDLDSIKEFNDSVARSFLADARRTTFRMPRISREDSTRAMAQGRTAPATPDTAYASLPPEKKQRVVKAALNRVQMYASELDMKGDYMKGKQKQQIVLFVTILHIGRKDMLSLCGIEIAAPAIEFKPCLDICILVSIIRVYKVVPQTLFRQLTGAFIQPIPLASIRYKSSVDKCPPTPFVASSIRIE